MLRLLTALFLIVGTSLQAEPAEQFTIAAYNVENWNSIERNGKPNQPKPSAAKSAVVAVISAVRPDVLAMEEMGKTNDLAELRTALLAQGFDYRDQEWIEGPDPDRHVCLLSRFPIVSRHSRTDYAFQVDGQSSRMSRGILDVLIKVNDGYSFRAIVAHLKSKRQSAYGDQAAIRLEEARQLRSHIGKILKDAPDQNLIAMGDFNDTPDSEPIHALIGVPPFQLFALLPVDSAGNDGTHYWRARREFSRIDYLITSPGMSHEYVAGSARIAEVPGWDKASDHRMIYASFLSHDMADSEKGGGIPLVWAIIAGTVVVAGVVLVLWLRKRRR